MTDARRRVLILGAEASLAVVMAERLTEHGIEVELAEPPAKGVQLTFVVQAPVLTQFIERLQERELVPVFEKPWRDPRPYGKNARRQLRGGRHD